MRVASDVGGTFTDLVYIDVDADETGRKILTLKTAKTDTTPPNYEEGVIRSLEKAGVTADKIAFLAHGTTVVINALTERKGVVTGLITTRGFRDVLAIGRGNRPALFDFRYAKPRPFVPRYLRQEVTERIDYSGRVVTPLRMDEVPPIVAHFQAEGVKAVAICFLHAYANPDNEAAVADRVRTLWPDVAVVASHQITREWREYERTNTTVLSGYVQPIATRYIDNLERKLVAKGFRGEAVIMQSNGGVDTLDGSRAHPITMLESGPASGVLGAAALGRIIGESNIITLDIGGTTAKCSLIEDGQIRINTDYHIERTRDYSGHPVMVPTVDIVEIGQGGGSIAWMDEDGRLNVGPQSAGALPGPAAYGRGGTEPTTTDANLVARRIDPDYVLGGEIKADMESVRAAFAGIAERLGVTIEGAARGIIRVANNNMTNALKLVSVNRGFDPRDFTLVAFGGGGGLHASALASELGIPRVIIPVNCSVFSAWGMLHCDIRRDHVLTRLTTLERAAAGAVVDAFAELAERALAESSSGAHEAETEILFERFVDMRYHGQEHSVRIALTEDGLGPAAIERIVERFHESHEREYSYTLDSPVEFVTYHLVAISPIDRPDLPAPHRTGAALHQAMRTRRMVDYDVHGVHSAEIFERSRLEPGMELHGPAVIEEPAATVVVFPGDRVCVDDHGNLHLELDESRQGPNHA